jgi:bla regulator protein blaR1
MSTFQLVFDHLWQSTLITGGIALAAMTMRRNSATVRHALWFVASVKFVIPFAVFGAIGAAIGARAPLFVPQPAPDFLVDAASVPFVAESARAGAATSAAAGAFWSAASMPALLAGVWAVGCALVLGAFAMRWIRAIRAVRSSTSLDSGREVEILRRVERGMAEGETTPRRPMPVHASDATIEPGVFGLFRPVLVWPRSMSEHLSDAEIEAIVLHELSHVRRHDNLTALVHAVVQSICWFHPLVWWIGARLIDERERACDEDVVRMGRDRRVYAESLLKTCQFCVGAPVTSMAGVTGSDLKRRVSMIMVAPVGTRLGAAARALLVVASVAAVAVPVIGGAAGVPQVTGVKLPDPAITFDAASVRQNTGGGRDSSSRAGNGNVAIRSMPLAAVLLNAFQVQPAQIIGGPSWMTSDRFDIVAKSGPETSDSDLKLMLQNLLIERFAIKARIETRSLPVYALVFARSDRRLGPDLQADPCETPSSGPGPCGSGPGTSTTGPARSAGAGAGGGGGGRGGGTGAAPGGSGSSGSGMSSSGLTMARFAEMLSRSVDRAVIDRTGLEGGYTMKLRFSAPRPPGAGDPPADAPPDLFTALQEQLGLKLESTRGPVEVLVIDSAQHPVNDNFVMPESQPRESR